MKYMGSKARIAKYILPIILKDRAEGQWYVEPFCGGCNALDKVTGKRIGCDSNPDVIDAMVAIRDNPLDLPKNNEQFTESDYKGLRRGNHKYKCYAGFAFSFGGKWLGGWSRTYVSGVSKRDYVAESYRNAIRQSPLLQGVRLFHKSYQKLTLKEPCVIYCDPPYAGTTGYKDGAFDHAEFWQWCRDRSMEGHQVFISEYNAPEDFECVWEGELGTQLGNGTKSGTKKTVERLFKYAPACTAVSNKRVLIN